MSDKVGELVEKYGKFKCPHCGLEQILIPSDNFTPPALAASQPMDLTAKQKGDAAIAVGLTVYARMVRLSHDSNQTVGEKRSYYVTLEQLESAFVSVRDEIRRQP